MPGSHGWPLAALAKVTLQPPSRPAGAAAHAGGGLPLPRAPARHGTGAGGDLLHRHVRWAGLSCWGWGLHEEAGARRAVEGPCSHDALRARRRPLRPPACSATPVITYSGASGQQAQAQEMLNAQLADQAKAKAARRSRAARRLQQQQQQQRDEQRARPAFQ